MHQGSGFLRRSVVGAQAPPDATCHTHVTTHLRLSAGGSDTPLLARRYSGFFNAVVAGTYRFSLTSDDGSFLWLDGASTPLINDFTADSGQNCGASREVTRSSALGTPSQGACSGM